MAKIKNKFNYFLGALLGFFGGNSNLSAQAQENDSTANDQSQIGN
jgi:hypothetical protein